MEEKENVSSSLQKDESFLWPTAPPSAEVSPVLVCYPSERGKLQCSRKVSNVLGLNTLMVFSINVGLSPTPWPLRAAVCHPLKMFRSLFIPVKPPQWTSINHITWTHFMCMAPCYLGGMTPRDFIWSDVNGFDYTVMINLSCSVLWLSRWWLEIKSSLTPSTQGSLFMPAATSWSTTQDATR